jgi:hypothetical protein
VAQQSGGNGPGIRLDCARISKARKIWHTSDGMEIGLNRRPEKYGINLGWNRDRKNVRHVRGDGNRSG